MVYVNILVQLRIALLLRLNIVDLILDRFDSNNEFVEFKMKRRCQ
jgi:hypothetical protein